MLILSTKKKPTISWELIKMGVCAPIKLESLKCLDFSAVDTMTIFQNCIFKNKGETKKFHRLLKENEIDFKQGTQ